MMNKVIAFVICLSVFGNAALADCDFSKGISKMPNGHFDYSPECHLKVGQLVQDNDTKDKQIQDLTKALTLKDLAIQKSDARTQLWMDTSFKLEDYTQKVDTFNKRNEWVYFGLGVLTTFAAGYAAASLSTNSRH